MAAITKIDRIRREDLARELEVNLTNIITGSAYGREFKIVSGKLIYEKFPIKLSRAEYDESVTYNIITAFLNFIRFYNPRIKKDKQILLRKGEKILPHKYYQILKNAFSIKEILRKNRKISKAVSFRLKENGIMFIKFLTKRLD